MNQNQDQNYTDVQPINTTINRLLECNQERQRQNKDKSYLFECLKIEKQNSQNLKSNLIFHNYDNMLKNERNKHDYNTNKIIQQQNCQYFTNLKINKINTINEYNLICEYLNINQQKQLEEGLVNVENINPNNYRYNLIQSLKKPFFKNT